MSTHTHKVAIFRNVEAGYNSVFECHSADQTDFCGHPRISEIVTVQFPLLPPGDTVAAQVAILDGHIAKITAEFAARLDGLKSRKAELLAITHDEPHIVERWDCGTAVQGVRS